MLVLSFTLALNGSDLLYFADPGRAISTFTQSRHCNTLPVELKSLHFDRIGGKRLVPFARN